MKRVCVYCGSSAGFNEVYRRAARDLGNALVRNNLELVYGGAAVGLMGEIANSVMQAGGTVIGIIPQAFAQKVAHHGITELHIVGSMHERKQRMADLSDAFIALPGGFGTIEELTELLTWAQIGLHKKPCGVFNVSGYFNPFLAFLDHAVSEGFLKQKHRELFLVSVDADSLLKRFESFEIPEIEKWADLRTEGMDRPDSLH